MAQPSPNPEKSGVTLQPPCSTCGSPMWLIGLSRVDDKHDLRQRVVAPGHEKRRQQRKVPRAPAAHGNEIVYGGVLPP